MRTDGPVAGSCPILDFFSAPSHAHDSTRARNNPSKKGRTGQGAHKIRLVCHLCNEATTKTTTPKHSHKNRFASQHQANSTQLNATQRNATHIDTTEHRYYDDAVAFWKETRFPRDQVEIGIYSPKGNRPTGSHRSVAREHSDPRTEVRLRNGVHCMCVSTVDMFRVGSRFGKKKS